MDYSILVPEIQNDPLGRGYSAMSDAEVATDLSTEYRTDIASTLTSAEIYESMDVTEFQGKTDAQKEYVRDILGLGGVVAVGPSSKARAVMLAIFGGGSNTIQALADALESPISRANELGIGNVSSGHIASAREQIGA